MNRLNELYLHGKRKPKVLLIGNGLLQLCGGISWDDLLRSISDDKRTYLVSLEDYPWGCIPASFIGFELLQLHKSD